jgi:hypothetical protein
MLYIIYNTMVNRNLRKIRDVIANGVERNFISMPVFDPQQAKINLEKEEQEREIKSTEEEERDQQTQLR